MHTSRNFSRALALCLLIGAPAALRAQSPGAAPAAPADPMALLKAIPADATAFIGVGSLKSLDSHVQGLAQQLQLQGIIPGPLDWLKANTGINKGLNENGGVAFVVLNCSTAKTADEIGDKLVILISASDPAGLIESLGGEKGDLSTVKLMGKDSAAAAKDNFVVMAEKPETVKAFLTAKPGVDKTMSPDRVKKFAQEDIFVWINPATISKELRQQAKDAFSGLMAMGAMGAPMPAEGGPADQLDKTIEQSQELTIGLSANPKAGLILSYYVKMKPGSEMGKQIAAIKGVDGSLLVGLPNEQAIAVFGAVGAGGDPAAVKQLDQVFGQVLQMYEGLLSNVGIQLEPGKLTGLKDPLVKLVANMERMAMSASVLPVEGGEGRLGLTVASKVKNSAQWQAEAHKFFDLVKELIVETAKKNAGEDNQKMIKGVADAIQWKEKAEKVEGAAVDHFVVDLDAIVKASSAEEVAEEDKAELEKVKSFTGKEGILFRIAAIGDDHVVVTFGGGSKRFAQVMQSVKSKDAQLAESKEIKKVAGRLPKGPRVCEGYLSLENLLALVSSTMQQMGQPMPFPLALNNAAPLALTAVKIDDSATHTEILVPVELMVSVKELVGPLMMMMGGGMGGPPEPDAAEPAPGGELN